MRRTTEPGARLRPPGLRRRLIIALSIPLVVILGGSSVFDYRMARRTADSNSDQGLADAVFDLETHLRDHGLRGRGLDLRGESEAIARSNLPDVVHFSVRDAAGRLLAGDPEVAAPAWAGSAGVGFADGAYRGQAVRLAAHRLRLEERDIVLTVQETTVRRQQSRHEILTALLLPNLAVIFVSLVAVLFGVRQGLLPLEAVEKEIAARSPDDLREIDLLTAPREIHPMLRRLNELFGVLRTATAAQNRFIADAAHQLRTPLAGLQTQIDLAVGEGAFAGNAGRRQSIEQGTEQIGRLLGQLLSYARAEAPAVMAGRRERVALDLLVEESASLFLDRALGKDIDFGFEIAPAAVSGIAWLIAEALGNLIDNAIRYTPPGGRITVRCGERAGRAFLEVEDNGPGIAEIHRAEVFRRFYRIPGSAGSGCGLGLPIVREIAEQHGARVRLASGGTGGLRVVLSFAPATETPGSVAASGS